MDKERVRQLINQIDESMVITASQQRVLEELKKELEL